jgi:uncharacterized protein YchJ
MDMEFDRLIKWFVNLPPFKRAGVWKRVRASMNADLEKTGRNDPCPCGSGKKFKRCCKK